MVLDYDFNNGLRDGKERNDPSPPCTDPLGRIAASLSDSESETAERGKKYMEGYQTGLLQSIAKDASGDDDDDGNGRICYLTTACTVSRGLPDNCLELTTLRWFRDNFLLPNPDGKAAVKEYYKIAPKIVAAIDAREDAKRIWNSVYDDVQKAVSLVRAGKFNESFEHYKAMTMKLKRGYLN